MKKLLPMLLLIITATVYAQDLQTPLKKIEAIMNDGSKWRKSYTMTSDTVGAGVVSDKPLQVIDIKIWRHQKDITKIEPLLNELTAELGVALVDATNPISVNISYEEITFVPVASGQYRVTPIRVTSFCAGNFCSTTASGGNVIQHVSIVPSGTRSLITKHWQNY